MKKPKRLHYQWHHRRPRSLGVSDTARNLSHVSAISHQNWHALFRNYTPHKIAEIINETWLDADFEFVVRRKELK